MLGPPQKLHKHKRNDGAKDHRQEHVVERADGVEHKGTAAFVGVLPVHNRLHVEAGVNRWIQRTPQPLEVAHQQLPI